MPHEPTHHASRLDALEESQMFADRRTELLLEQMATLERALAALEKRLNATEQRLAEIQRGAASEEP